MEYGAIDLHSRRSQVRIVTGDGDVVLERKVDTTRAGFARIFENRPRLRILMESSTDSEWVARLLEGMGHEVVVADPNYAAMYASRPRKVKTDHRDVAAMSDACRTGIYRRAHRVSAAARQLRQSLRVRSQLVQVRSRLISVVRTLLRQEGVRLPSGASETVLDRLARVEIPSALVVILEPLRATLGHVTTTLAALDQAVTLRARQDPVAQRLMTAPGVGPVVALTFQAVLDDPERFGGSAARASAFVGLVPSEDSSADRRHRGHITRTGPRDLRALLVQASWVIWQGRGRAGGPLTTWVRALAARRSRRIAVVALARRLTRILYAMWRDETTFVRGAQPGTAAA